MSLLFQPHRHHAHPNRRHQLTPYARTPGAFSASPWSPWNSDPFFQPFHQPFLSLFNDTFSELDRLSSDLNTQLGESLNRDSGLGKMLTLAPKFDIKETETEFLLEGELPGVEKKDISLDFVDDNTLVLKTRTEKVREEGAKPYTQQSGKLIEGQGDASKDSDVQMSGANQDAAAEGKTGETSVTKAEGTQEVAKTSETPKPTYHLTERSVGTFQRVFSLPGELKHDEVKASLKNGILTVTIPKVVKKRQEEEKKSRSVTIEDEPEEGGEEKSKS